MKIRILTAEKGLPAGTVVDLDDAVATVWLGSGRGESVASDETPKKPSKANAETATADPTRKRSTESR